MSAYAMPSITSAPELGVPPADTVLTLNEIAVVRRMCLWTCNRWLRRTDATGALPRLRRNLRLPRRRPDHADHRRQSLPRVQTQEMAFESTPGNLAAQGDQTPVGASGESPTRVCWSGLQCLLA